LNCQNNYAERLALMTMLQKVLILATSLSVLHNYFNSPTKLFSDLYQAEFLDTLAKLPCSPYFCYYPSLLLSLT